MAVQPSKKEELISYFDETLKAIKVLKGLAQDRNKTTRIKAVISMLSLIEARVDAAWKYAKSGGQTEFDVFFQQNLYNPIIQWLSEEVVA